MRKITYLLIAVFLSGCAMSGYQQFYKPYVDVKILSDVELLHPSEEPKIYGTDNFERDIKILRSKRYILVGSSSFNAGYEDESQVKAQAKRVGATVVLVRSEYTNTQTTTVPLFLPNSTTTYHSGSIYGGRVYGHYSGTSTTYGNTVVPITTSQRRYDQMAVFFVKSNQQIKFGVSIADLTNEIRRKIERNAGALIDVVIEDTPAFFSNVLPGDILIGIDGTMIKSAANAQEIIKSYDTSRGHCLWKVIRNGKEKEIIIKFQLADIQADYKDWSQPEPQFQTSPQPTNALKKQIVTASEYNLRGFEYYKNAQYNQAIEQFTIALSMENNSSYYINRGFSFYELNQYDKAISDFKQAINLAPNVANTYAGCGNVYFVRKSYNEAWEYFSKAIAIEPNKAIPYLSRGYTSIKMGNKSMAASDFKKACDLGNEDGCKQLKVLENK